MNFSFSLPARIALMALACSPVVLAQTPSNIEAAEYDPQGDRWFVSNGSSLLVTEDLGETWGFFGEAEASHGMEVMNGVLYAIGQNIIRAYDLDDATLLGSLAIPNVGFLNGMGNNGAGMLVVSDFSGGRMYSVNAADPAAMTHMQLTGNLGVTPNGVVIDEANNRAIVVCWGNDADILAIDLESGDVSTLVDGTGLGNLDGIDRDGNGQYYVSAWTPTRVVRYNSDFSEAEIVLTAADGLSSPADISYDEGADILGVANSGSNEVTFHSFGDPINSVGETRGWSAVHQGDRLVLNLPTGRMVEWVAYDAAGRVAQSREEWLPAGQVNVTWPLASPGGVVVIQSGTDVLRVR